MRKGGMGVKEDERKKGWKGREEKGQRLKALD